jgi:exosome complex component RRP4
MSTEKKEEKETDGKGAADKPPEKSAEKAASTAYDSGQPAGEAGVKGLLKKNRNFVIPGDKIVETMDYLPGKNCFRKGDSVFAKKIGLVSVNGRVVSVIPLNEVYVAKPGDMVMGEVTEVQSNGWVVDINATVEAYMPLSGVREFIDTTKTDISRYYATGDVIYAKVSMANHSTVHLSMDDSRARKFRSGRVISFNPAKVPRLIGKQGSMISLIKGKTGCRISVGQNGLVWLEGENEELAIEAIKLVENESYIEGLTDRVSALLDKAAPARKAEPAKADEKDAAKKEAETKKDDKKKK